MNKLLKITLVTLLMGFNYSCQQCQQSKDELNGPVSLSYGGSSIFSITSHNAKITRNGTKLALFIQGNEGIPPYLDNTTTSYKSVSINGELNGEKPQEIDVELSYSDEIDSKSQQSFSEKVHMKITKYDIGFDKSIHIQGTLQGTEHEDKKSLTGTISLDSNNCQVFPVQ